MPNKKPKPVDDRTVYVIRGGVVTHVDDAELSAHPTTGEEDSE